MAETSEFYLMEQSSKNFLEKYFIWKYLFVFTLKQTSYFFEFGQLNARKQFLCNYFRKNIEDN